MPIVIRESYRPRRNRSGLASTSVRLGRPVRFSTAIQQITLSKCVNGLPAGSHTQLTTMNYTSDRQGHSVDGGSRRSNTAPDPERAVPQYTEHTIRSSVTRPRASSRITGLPTLLVTALGQLNAVRRRAPFGNAPQTIHACQKRHVENSISSWRTPQCGQRGFHGRRSSVLRSPCTADSHLL